MRALLLLAAILALPACGNNDQTGNMQNVDENLTAENIVSNDVTAIDAVTGDAANMAADVDLNFGNLDQPESNLSTNEPAPSGPRKPAARTPRRAAEPANTATNAANNAAANAATNAQ